MRALVVLVFLAMPLAAARADFRPPDLSLALLASGTNVRVGDTVTYTATVRNHGPGVVIHAGAGFELRGTSVTNEHATASRGFCIRVPGTPADVNCELRDVLLQAGANLIFTLTLRPTRPGRLQVYVSDYSNTKNADGRNDVAVVYTRVR